MDITLNKKNIENEKKIKYLSSKIKELAFIIDKVEDEKLEVTNQLKKALSDYSNLERDMDKRVNLRALQSKVSLAKSLFKSIEDIGYAIKAADGIEKTEQMNNWLEGMKSILAGIEKSLLEIGVEVINVNKGDEFNSEIHDVVTTIKDTKENEIYDVLEKGYKIGDVVIKSAKVFVGAK